jgi:hypothetical protein
MIYAGKKDKAQTLNWLMQAYQERNGRLANLAVHPQFLFLHGDGSFEALLEKMGRGTTGQANKAATKS